MEHSICPHFEHHPVNDQLNSIANITIARESRLTVSKHFGGLVHRLVQFAEFSYQVC